MTDKIALGSELMNALVEAGLLPRMCTHFEFEAEPMKPVRFRYEVLATQAQLATFARLLIENTQEAEPWLREAVAKDPWTGRTVAA